MSYSDETLRRPRKVAFYGRVSTELEAQTAALKSQMEWYHKLAAQYPNWSVVNQYADDGVTGTVKEVRRAFMKMLCDAKEGKFDLIVTREVSRFARNTVDTVETVRELRQCGVEVYFVMEDIWTMESDGELRLSILACLAQEESRKISERSRAGQQVKRERGEPSAHNASFGYVYDRQHKTLAIEADKVEAVRKIFEMYADGISCSIIADELNMQGIRNKDGSDSWTTMQVRGIIKNPILKDVAELESAKQEGLVVERAYKALRRSYDTKISQEKALLARLQERWQVPEMGDVFTWNDLFPDEKVSREFLDAFVPRIISLDGERFIWELQLMQNHCTVQCEREGAGADAQIRIGKIVQEPPE